MFGGNSRPAYGIIPAWPETAPAFPGKTVLPCGGPVRRVLRRRIRQGRTFSALMNPNDREQVVSVFRKTIKML